MFRVSQEVYGGFEVLEIRYRDCFSPLTTFDQIAAKYLRDSRIFLSVLNQLNEGFTVFGLSSLFANGNINVIYFCVLKILKILVVQNECQLLSHLGTC